MDANDGPKRWSVRSALFAVHGARQVRSDQIGLISCGGCDQQIKIFDSKFFVGTWKRARPNELGDIKLIGQIFQSASVGVQDGELVLAKSKESFHGMPADIPGSAYKNLHLEPPE